MELPSRCIFPFSSEYPVALHDLDDPPATLFAQGECDFNSRPVLGIVGTRESSLLAEAWMRETLPQVARNVVTVSGGARGIDEMAHRISVSEKQPTAVVLPSSIDRPYPHDWADRKVAVIASGGCFISEYPPGTDIRRWHFEKRNRLIAALADVVLIVEARKRSGTAITARHAIRMHRGLGAVPWFPTDSRGELCNDLIASGAILIRDTADLMALLARESHARSTRMLGRIDAYSRASALVEPSDLS